MRTLADLIAFNQAHCDAEMRYFGQELFEIAESTTGLDDPAYIAARALCLDLTRTNGYDKLMADLKLDAIASPIYSSGSNGPAVAGYPIISVPTGVTEDGRPGGIWLSAGFLDEPTLLAIAYDLEQEIGGRPQPTYLGVRPGSAAGRRPVRRAARRPRSSPPMQSMPAGWPSSASPSADSGRSSDPGRSGRPASCRPPRYRLATRGYADRRGGRILPSDPRKRVRGQEQRSSTQHRTPLTTDARTRRDRAGYREEFSFSCTTTRI